MQNGAVEMILGARFPRHVEEGCLEGRAQPTKRGQVDLLEHFWMCAWAGCWLWEIEHVGGPAQHVEHVEEGSMRKRSGGHGSD